MVALSKVLLFCAALSEGTRVNRRQLVKLVEQQRTEDKAEATGEAAVEGWWWSKHTAEEGKRSQQEAQIKARATLEQMTKPERDQLLQGVGFKINMQTEPGYYTGTTLPIPRLGVPALKLSDAGNGFRPTEASEAGTSTCWPSLLALAASWDEQAVGTVAQAIAKEFRGKGANVLLGPSVNVHRVARNGRNFEYISGEDPYLGSRLVPPYVEAVQGEGLIATVKHFAMNEQETNRMTENSIVDEKTAWNLYYPPFEAGVKAGAGAVMCSYNQVNGKSACHNSKLLQEDLESGMGFTGFVMSDWGANHGVDSMDAGLDQDMPGYIQTPFGLFSPWSTKELDAPGREQAIDEAAFRVLTSMYRMGLDDCGTNGTACCAPPNCTAQLDSDQTSDEHRALARSVAATSSVLLKNDEGILPLNLTKVQKIAVLGSGVHTTKYYAGGGSGNVPIKSPTTPFEAILAEAIANKVQITDDLTAADVAIIISGTETSEGIDRFSLYLDNLDDMLIRSVASLKPTVVVTLVPGDILMPWRDMAKGILTMFMAGEGTGLAVADLLFGKQSPAGKLPVMIPEGEEDTISPTLEQDVVYAEGMLTSYRNPHFKAAFPFGHGLTYTTFKLSPAHVLPAGDKSCPTEQFVKCVALEVENTGRRDGKEVVQVYLEFALSAGMPRMLRQFHKTNNLKPGEKEQVLMGFTMRDLSVYQPGPGWVPQTEVKAHVGTSSAKIHSTLDL